MLFYSRHFADIFFAGKKGFWEIVTNYLLTYFVFSVVFDYPCRIGGQRCLMIEIHHLYKQCGNDVYVLEDINLVIDRGEFCFYRRPQRRGQINPLKAAFAGISATRGFIKIFGRDITRLRKREIPLLRRNIGMVFQVFVSLKIVMSLKMLLFPSE